jgi:nucleoside-diphosphate-sugar epimerase
MSTKILIIGACGQIGTELTQKLRAIYGVENVIASDIRKLNVDVVNSGPFEVVNALDYNQIQHLVEIHKIDEVYFWTYNTKRKHASIYYYGAKYGVWN